MTQEPFRAGDKVVFCAGGCDLAFHENSWVSFFNEEHCKQTDTLSTFPSPRSSRRFSNKKSRQDNNIPTNEQPTGTPVVPPLNSKPSPVYAFSPNTFSIHFGQSITLSWDVAADYAVSINNGIGSVRNTGVRTITPSVWYWGWLWLRNKRRTTYVLTAIGPNGTFRNKLKIDLTLPALPAAISRTIQLAPLSVMLSGILTLGQQIARLGRAAVLSNYKHLRIFFRLKQNQITLGDYVALIKLPEIIRNPSKMPFYQRILVGFSRRFKQWANTA